MGQLRASSALGGTPAPRRVPAPAGRSHRQRGRRRTSPAASPADRRLDHAAQRLAARTNAAAWACVTRSWTARGRIGPYRLTNNARSRATPRVCPRRYPCTPTASNRHAVAWRCRRLSPVAGVNTRAICAAARSAPAACARCAVREGGPVDRRHRHPWVARGRVGFGWLRMFCNDATLRIRRTLRLLPNPQGPRMDISIALAVDPCPGASLLVGGVATGTLPRRASPAGQLARDHRSICPFAGPYASRRR